MALDAHPHGDDTHYTPLALESHEETASHTSHGFIPSGPSPQKATSSFIALLLLLALTSTALSLYTLPLNRVIELRLCRSYYLSQDPSIIGPHGEVDEELCKVDAVQRDLAWLAGVMETVSVLCDFLVTVPFGFVAERWGRRMVLWCNMIARAGSIVWVVLVGNFDSVFPTKLILAGPFLYILGGDCVFASTIYALIANLTDDHVQRASYFAYVSSVQYAIAFVGPSIASFTMSQNLWLPFCIGLVLLLLAIPTIYCLPDIFHKDHRSHHHMGSDSDLCDVSPLLGDTLRPPSKPLMRNNIASMLSTLAEELRSLARLILGRRNFQLLLLSFILTGIASSDTKLLTQYISKRYKWTFAEAGYLLSAKATVNIVLLTLIVPTVISFSMARIRGPEAIFHYYAAEVSLGISIIGVLCIAFSVEIWMLVGSLVIYALGSALGVFTISLVKSPAVALADQPHSETQDFNIVVLTKTLGFLLGTPFMTALWVKGIGLGGAGLGLPYFVSGSIYAVAAVVIAQLKLEGTGVKDGYLD